MIVLYTLLLQMAFQYLLFLVCTVCCDSVIYVTFTNGFTISPISDVHCLLWWCYIRYSYKWFYHISYLWHALFALIVLYTILLQMSLQYLLSLVCIVCCNSVMCVIFTNGFTKSLISGKHCLL